MNRRTVLAATIVLAAAAGCQTLSFSTPSAVPSAQVPAQLVSGGAPANPVATASDAAAAVKP